MTVFDSFGWVPAAAQAVLGAGCPDRPSLSHKACIIEGIDEKEQNIWLKRVESAMEN